MCSCVSALAEARTMKTSLRKSSGNTMRTLPCQSLRLQNRA